MCLDAQQDAAQSLVLRAMSLLSIAQGCEVKASLQLTFAPGLMQAQDERRLLCPESADAVQATCQA